MSSRIEQLIDEIEDYIDGCKFQPLSKTNILVNKEEIDELLRELRMKTPDEIKRYQKIISNKEAILNDARSKAEALIKDATVQTTELINEHEIMQQAYAQANEVVRMATTQAQEILNNATMEANGVRTSAMQYLDEMLSNLENAMTATLAASTEHYESFFNTISGYNEIVKANRAELRPVEVEKMLKEAEGEGEAAPGPGLDLM
ncbi:MAG: vacuolar family H+-ATPase subunit H [Lachnospiraceae bacterium]|nr:vacuolar family H+-ATPase subunit H [Lachnospiraceae bacterium]